MKKRILTMAAALLTALTCVCACGGGETSQSQNSGNSAAEYDLEYAMAITSLEAGKRQENAYAGFRPAGKTTTA